MKNLTLIIVLTIIGLTSFAQLTLLHTFDAFVEYNYNTIRPFPENKYFYSNIEGNTGSQYIYNADFSLDNSFSITPNNLPDGYVLGKCQFLSNNLINTDNEYEWLIVGYNASAELNNKYYAYISNSQGIVVQDFGYCGYIYDICFFISNGQLRVWVSKMYYDYETNQQKSTEIYSCGGSVTRIAESKGKNSTNAYPNPATSFINLSYELNNGETSTMNIYDINGRLIEQKPIGYHFKNLELNVSNYKTGTYIYEYNGKSNRFVVQ